MKEVGVLALDVQLCGVSIGTLTRTSGDTTLLTFSDEYIDQPDRDTLSLSFMTHAGTLRTAMKPCRMRLMPFFSNLLPEGHMREYLAGLGGVHPEREVFLLWLLGEDLPGAVQVRNQDGAALPPGHVESQEDGRRRGAARPDVCASLWPACSSNSPPPSGTEGSPYPPTVSEVPGS